MIPYNIYLKDIDDGLVKLVKDLNRIPGIGTMSTCEGHTYEKKCNYLCQDGWLYFYVTDNQNSEVVDIFEQFCNQHRNFTFVSCIDTKDAPKNSLLYEINAIFQGFEEHREDNSIWTLDMSEEERSEAFKDTRDQKARINEGWKELDKRIRQYITERISEDIESLPFHETKEENMDRLFPQG